MSKPAIVDGRQSGTWFYDHDGLTRPRDVPVRKIVLHFTAGEGDAARIHHTLEDRGLSIHFTIDRDGRIVQHAGLDRVCSHAGRAVNADSIGIEIASCGVAPAHPRFPRDVSIGTVHGRRVKFLRYYPEQTAAVLDLVPWLCSSLGVPRVVCEAPTALAPKALRDFAGVIGHYQITTKKVDPGPELMAALAAALA